MVWTPLAFGPASIGALAFDSGSMGRRDERGDAMDALGERGVRNFRAGATERDVYYRNWFAFPGPESQRVTAAGSCCCRCFSWQKSPPSSHEQRSHSSHTRQTHRQTDAIAKRRAECHWHWHTVSSRSSSPSLPSYSLHICPATPQVFGVCVLRLEVGTRRLHPFPPFLALPHLLSSSSSCREIKMPFLRGGCHSATAFRNCCWLGPPELEYPMPLRVQISPSLI